MGTLCVAVVGTHRSVNPVRDLKCVVATCYLSGFLSKCIEQLQAGKLVIFKGNSHVIFIVHKKNLWNK